MVVCYGSAVRPINQAASWLPEVMHVKGPVVSPQKPHRRNQGRKVHFPCSAHWSSVRASGGSPRPSRHQHVVVLVVLASAS